MSLAQEMLAVAKACMDRPNTDSVWVEELQRYVCVEDPKYKKMAARSQSEPNVVHPPIDSAFKFAVWVSGGLGLLLVVFCFTATVLAGKDPPSLLEYLVKSLFTIAQTALGTALGLLGAPALLHRTGGRRNRKGD